MNNIEIKNVTKKYDGFLLDKISLITWVHFSY